MHKGFLIIYMPIHYSLSVRFIGTKGDYFSEKGSAVSRVEPGPDTGRRKNMRRVVYSDKAPKAVGPYSQAIHMGSLIFTSGQLPLDPASGKLVPGEIKEQARQVMENLKSVLEAAGADFSKVLKVNVYLSDLSNFGDFNEIYGSYFPLDPPARSTVQVAALPLGAKVEVEMVALG
jgi:2-iminobutanoate/2-iminopropanoate deaminase